MKKFFLILPIFLGAESFNELVKLINNSNVVKIYQKNVAIQKEKLNQVKAVNYGKVDLEYDYIYLNERPIIKMHSPQPIAAKNLGNSPLYPLVYKEINTKLYAGKKNNFIGELVYSYPLFTGYAISNLIEIEKLNLIKEKLKLQNIKRDLK